jgi:propanol-preferring alcohol dehydrogenase
MEKALSKQRTLRGWQLVRAQEPLRTIERDAPEPGPGEVLLAVRGSGLCHSDVAELDRAENVAFKPIILGHEIAGEVTALGTGVDAWAVGDRVAVCPTASPSTPGYTRDGGFANFHLAPASDLVAIPEDVDWTLGAMMTDAGMTSYHALMVRGGCTAGMKVGIIGMGGLGQLAARVAVLTGAEVHVAEQKQDIWPLARELGVTDVVSDAAEWDGKDFDLVVDYAGFGTTTRAAVRAIRFDGTVVQVGLGRPEITISTVDLVVRNARLLASIGGTPDDIRALYELLRSGDLTPSVTEITFEDIPAGVEALKAGQVTGRLVARFP